ncbi:SCO2400 family protein [Streptomyces sediminimaris]|uniref:SCO2400 family protein n=1 Tax=Streptomyces sediminimaris TaxID=3383721 RepID=UPI003999EBD0
MDYCSSCRRHLNGALVCPGCGAYAPDIAPVAGHGHRFDAIPADRPSAPRAIPHEPLEETPAAETVLPAGGGRAARRRQRERWRKSRRKAVLATTVALVGGGLAVSTLDGGSGHRAEAATAPDLTSTDAQELPAQQHSEPAATAPGTGKHRKPTATDAGPAATGTSRQSSAVTPEALHTASERTQPYTAPAAQRRTTAHTATGTAAGTSGGTGGTTPSQSPSPTPSAGTSSSGTSSSGTSQSGSSASNTSTSGTSGSGSSASGTSTSSGGTAATSPSGICVLGLLCLS